MCNLYNITTTHEAMRRLFPKFGDMTNRVDPQLDIFPDYPAPVLRNVKTDGPELAMLRWGMPTPPMYVKGEADSGVTNIRNLTSPHWRRWQSVEAKEMQKPLPDADLIDLTPSNDNKEEQPNLF